MRSAVLAGWILLSGCVSIPAFSGGNPDGGGSGSGSGDAPASPFQARVVGQGYRNSGEDADAVGSPSMSKGGYAVGTGNVAPGELELIAINVDNGDTTSNFIHLPAGFTKLAEAELGMGETQTYAVGWKLAGASEPATYTGTYQAPNNTSGAATVLLVAIGGVGDAPIEMAFANDSALTAPSDPAQLVSPGVPTQGPGRMIVWIGGTNWAVQGGVSTFTPPVGHTVVGELDDRTNHLFDWSSEAVTTAIQPAAGPSGMLLGTFSGVDDHDASVHIAAGWWTVAIAVAPK